MNKFHFHFQPSFICTPIDTSGGRLAWRSSHQHAEDANRIGTSPFDGVLSSANRQHQNLKGIAVAIHKVFISYYHFDNQKYKNHLVKNYNHLMIGKSVDDGDIDSDVSATYVKRLIQEGYLSDSSVLVALIGPNTKKRKHVDWEMSAALMAKVGGHSGLLGVFLPEVQRSDNGGWYYDDMPPRLADNIKSGFASYCSWDNFTANFSKRVEIAFNNRICLKDQIDNSRPQMQRNLT